MSLEDSSLFARPVPALGAAGAGLVAAAGGATVGTVVGATAGAVAGTAIMRSVPLKHVVPKTLPGVGMSHVVRVLYSPVTCASFRYPTVTLP